MLPGSCSNGEGTSAEALAKPGFLKVTSEGAGPADARYLNNQSLVGSLLEALL